MSYIREKFFSIVLGTKFYPKELLELGELDLIIISCEKMYTIQSSPDRHVPGYHARVVKYEDYIHDSFLIKYSQYLKF